MIDSVQPKRLPKLSRRYLWLSLIATGIGLVLGSLLLVFWLTRQAEDIHLINQERTAKLVASGLANAVYNDLITRDHGMIESRLLQAMSTDSLMSVMLMDGSGKLLAHVRRDPRTGQPVILYDRATYRLPDDFSRFRIDRGIVEYWTEIGKPIRTGALRVQLSLSAHDSALLSLQAQMTWILTGTGIALMLVLSLMLRQTYELLEARESGWLQVQRHLTSVAYRDALTGLPNRHVLRAQMERLMQDSDAQGTGFALGFLDLDEFKAVNDRFGHDAGDQLLVQFAERLGHSLRQSDMAVRLGGDEFVILLSGVANLEAAQPILDRMMAIANKPARWKGQDMYFGISMGVALYPSEATTVDELVDRADRAMYAAKRSGKSRWLPSAPQEHFSV